MASIDAGHEGGRFSFRDFFYTVGGTAFFMVVLGVIFQDTLFGGYDNETGEYIPGWFNDGYDVNVAQGLEDLVKTINNGAGGE